jgi:hypothetical protein
MSIRSYRLEPAPTDPSDHVVSRGQLPYLRPDLLDHPKALVPEDQEVVAIGGGSVLTLVDLVVGPVEADPKDADPNASAVRDLVQGRLGHVGEVGAPRLPRMDGDGLHDAPSSPWEMAQAALIRPMWLNACG